MCESTYAQLAEEFVNRILYGDSRIALIAKNMPPTGINTAACVTMLPAGEFTNGVLSGEISK